MLFNSYQFLLIFLPAAVLVYRAAYGYPGARNWVLVILSLLFYSYWDVRFLPLMIGSILANWWASGWYDRRRHKAVIVAAIAGNLAVFGSFKYGAFIAENISRLFQWPIAPWRLALPLGISFFTFHHIMYLVDLRRGRAHTYPLDRYALYICFFPQVLSGPLVRWNEVMEQFGKSAFAPGWQRRFVLGIVFVVVGLIQKTFLGDTLSHAVRTVYSTAQSGPLLDGSAWIATLGFSFQVFFDFSGYSDIAIGLALLFGIQLPLNFDAPFRAASLREFWRRWHMTLSRFLRDYLYIPLGGNRHGISRQVSAILVTMALGGMWHGAGWNFLVWGTLHGVALSAARLWCRYLPPPPRIVGWALTISFFILTLNVFRAPSFSVCMRMYEGLLVLPNIINLRGGRALLAGMFIAILLPPSHVICNKLAAAPRVVTALALALATVAVLVALGGWENYEFYYFQF